MKRDALRRFDRPRLRVDVVDHGATGRQGALLALQPLLQRETRGVCRSRVADHHLQRREVREVAIGIILLIGGQDALGEIAQGGRQRGVGGIRGRLESEILRGRERRPHARRDQEGNQEQDFRCEGFHRASAQDSFGCPLFFFAGLALEPRQMQHPREQRQVRLRATPDVNDRRPRERRA